MSEIGHGSARKHRCTKDKESEVSNCPKKEWQSLHQKYRRARRGKLEEIATALCFMAHGLESMFVTIGSSYKESYQ